MQEIILIFACLNKTGCEETYKAYYKNNPTLVEMVKDNEQRAKVLLKPYAVDQVLPFIMAATGQEVIFNLDKNFTIKNYKNITQLTFKKEF
jgi:uncharacterized protein (DUF1697 family)